MDAFYRYTMGPNEKQSENTTNSHFFRVAGTKALLMRPRCVAYPGRESFLCSPHQLDDLCIRDLVESFVVRADGAEEFLGLLQHENLCAQ
jgi:hypothetical protein